MHYQNNSSSGGIPDDLNQLMRNINDFFGHKAINTTVLIDEKSLKYILYESFDWLFNLEERYGTFGASLAMGNGYIGISKLLGKELSLDNNEESIKYNLEIIDQYCRLRLPNKFIDELDKLVWLLILKINALIALAALNQGFSFQLCNRIDKLYW